MDKVDTLDKVEIFIFHRYMRMHTDWFFWVTERLTNHSIFYLFN